MAGSGKLYSVGVLSCSSTLTRHCLSVDLGDTLGGEAGARDAGRLRLEVDRNCRYANR